MSGLTISAPQQRGISVEALIREARRHARRRRLRTTAIALALAGAAFSVWLGTRGAGVGADKLTAGPAAAPARNGPLTLINSGGGPGGIDVVGPNGFGRRLFAGAPRPFYANEPAQCVDIESVAWAPDGHRLALGCTSMGASAYDGLYIADARTGASTIIRPFRRPETDWTDLAWSPDGSTLAFITHGDIALVRGDGSGYRILPTGTQGFDRSPSWSADGRRIAYATRVASRWVVYAVDLDGSHRPRVARQGSWPAWSPAGGAIAYLSDCGVRLVTPSGKSLSRCIGVKGAPVWSPDGRKIAMAMGKGVYTMDANGGRLRVYARIAASSVAHYAGAGWRRPAWVPRRRSS
jgi:Tol biopolymer transport system component